MADVILRDFNGIDQTYEGVEKVKLNTSDGGTQVFSAGEALDDVEISLDFTKGNQSVTAGDGYLVKSATIVKPADLIPENIVKGITIAGITGTHESASSGGNGGGGGSAGGGLLPNIELKEILPEQTLTFAVGNSTYIPNTPAVVLADSTAVANMDVINDGEGGLVVFDGKVYPVYAGERSTSKIKFSWGESSLSVVGGIGNIGIPSAWMTGTVVKDTQNYGSSKEPFLIIANTSAGFVVAIPEDSTEFTHTLQIYKLIQTVYVTFMNGETELLKHPVIIDHNCEDVVATGVLATPTRDMTVSTVYTFSGWSLIEGGAVNSSALTNVTRDRTVYAVFDEAPRKYTVCFYDGDTVLSEQEVEYGKQATPPNAEKDGLKLAGWTLSDGASVTDFTITGATDFYAQWIEGIDFATATWAEIAAVSESGKASEMFAIGDTRTETLTYSDGTTEDIELQIAAFGIDKDFDTQKPVMTLITKNLISKTSAWSTYSNRWSYAFHQTDTFKTFLTDTVFPALSADLREVAKRCVNNSVNSMFNSANNAFYIMPPHGGNMGYSTVSGFSIVEGKTYPIFTADHSSRIKTLNGVAHNYAVYDNSYYTSGDRVKCVIKTDGTMSAANGSLSTSSGVFGVCFLLFI